jgi:subtilase family serine protease
MRSTIAAILLVALTLPAPGRARTEPDSLLSQHPVRVLFFLVRQRDDLGALALAVSSPTSKSYGRYPPIEAIAAKYGGSREAIERVTAFLAGVGANGEVDVTGTFVSALLDDAQVTAVFGAEPRAFPRVPEELKGAVSAIVGTFHSDSSLVFQRQEPPLARESIPSDEIWPEWSMGSGTPAPCPDTDDRDRCSNVFSNPGPPDAFRSITPDQLRTAYGIDETGLTGRGRRAVVLEFGQRVDPDDLRSYADGLGLPPIPFQQVLVDDRGTPLDVGVEATLDVETIAGIAPGLERLTLLTADIRTDADYWTYWPFLFSKALDASATGGVLTDVISVSWTIACEHFLPHESLIHVLESIFQTAAAAGVTVAIALGDQGSTACVPRSPPYDDAFLSVGYPGSSPWVTSVGATNLVLQPDNTIRDVQVWNDWPLALDRPLSDVECDTPPCRVAPVWGGGGGESVVFDRPHWQAGRGVDPVGSRQVPDLAFLGDIYPATLIHVRGDWSGEGNGTSQATPIFAAITLLLNEGAANAGRPRLGFANPLLYRLAARASRAYVDVVEGDNIVGDNEDRFDVDCCYAGPGYDKASGWGSLLLDRALDALEPAVSIAPRRGLAVRRR